MTDAAAHLAHGTARATIASVVATALGTYRRSFWRIVLAAFVVFAPVDLVVTLGATLAREFAERFDVLSIVLWTSGTALSVAGTMLSLVFFSGVLDRIVAVDQKGEQEIPFREVVRGLPTWRLIAASVLAALIVVGGLLLFLVPGLVFMVLFAVVGPVIVIEDLRLREAFRRSAVLSRAHPLLVVVAVLIPATLDEQLSSWFERFAWYEHPWVQLPLDVGSTIVVGGLVGVLEVTLAHALIADHRRRLEELAAAQPPDAPATGVAAEEAGQDSER